MSQFNNLYQEMIRFYAGNPKRIQHFTKVHSYARLIGELEHLPVDLLEILEMAALVHDIGIRPAEEKYGSSNGKLQEQEGPAVAKDMLEKLSIPKCAIDRICYLVGHHHTYTEIDGLDYQILVEADFLVNLFEDGSSADTAREVRERIFKTASGTWILNTMFGLEEL